MCLVKEEQVEKEEEEEREELMHNYRTRTRNTYLWQSIVCGMQWFFMMSSSVPVIGIRLYPAAYLHFR